MAFFQVPQAEGVGMRAETANECVDWIQLRVTEEPNPEFEVAGAASGVVDFSAGPVPQASPPERRFLLDVTIGSRQKRPARPLPQLQEFHRHSVVIESGGAAGNPLDFGKGAKDPAHHK